MQILMHQELGISDAYGRVSGPSRTQPFLLFPNFYNQEEPTHTEIGFRTHLISSRIWAVYEQLV